MINFIKEIVIGTFGTGAKQTLPLAYPLNETEPYCITAICGKNNTGKTHILREITQAFYSKVHNESERESINIHAILLDPKSPPPKLLHLADLTAYKNRLAEIPIGKHQVDPAGRTPQFRDAGISFMARHLSFALGESFDQEEWFANSEYRLSFAQTNLADRCIYACDSTDPVVERFEEAVDGKLYFGNRSSKPHIPHIQLMLRYDEHRAYYYPTWSDGQKILLSALLAIDHHKPEILFIDEIENHLHPEYMTQLTMFIKQSVPQTILVTHHPHVLFSSLVDRLFYIELTRDPLEEMPSKQQLTKGGFPRSPKRRIRQLLTDFDVITAAYGLFHNQDRQLLSLAQATVDAAEIILTRNIAAAFEPEIVDGAGGPFIDAQTKHLVEVLQSRVVSSSSVRVLDFGAGRGRTLKNILKYPAARRRFSVDWTFWDPDPVQREELEHYIKKLGLGTVHCIPEVRAIGRKTFDVAVLANVLHELTPKTFATVVHEIRESLVDDGMLVILELYPLIRPEKYAVPYTRQDMESILSDCGWKIESGFLPIRGGLVQTYWVCARNNEQISTERAALQSRIELTWRRILKESCVRYDGRRQVQSLQDQIELMGTLTTIASIANYELGNWV